MTHLRKMMLEELQRRNYAETTTRHYIRTVEDFSRRFIQFSKVLLEPFETIVVVKIRLEVLHAIKKGLLSPERLVRLTAQPRSRAMLDGHAGGVRLAANSDSQFTLFDASVGLS